MEENRIRKLRDETGMNRREFSEHFGIPVRTIEEWEAGRRTPPDYLPRLIEYQIKYEKLIEEVYKRNEKEIEEKGEKV